MKSLNLLNNVEKGKLLADLFPNELLKISEYIQAHYEMLSDNEDKIRKNWDTNIITVDMWYRLAEEVNRAIKQNGKKLLKSRCFAD
ncbi:hypothetical protein [Flavobacterium cerinum]|uniref:Uncharacterized protein n=1 Tax=Flavobacterium cerinum TaxID=2502784 RepID=A0ABY5IN23_9FLAO|nr:hypothetical protein [Flavobacterium cerinum]UUC44154.1 hypothetical protein NOX80_10970 [Flavobacterium cerinum]